MFLSLTSYFFIHSDPVCQDVFLFPAMIWDHLEWPCQEFRTITVSVAIQSDFFSSPACKYVETPSQKQVMKLEAC